MSAREGVPFYPVGAGHHCAVRLGERAEGLENDRRLRERLDGSEKPISTCFMRNYLSEVFQRDPVAREGKHSIGTFRPGRYMLMQGRCWPYRGSAILIVGSESKGLLVAL